jgi:glucose-6-phosphate 1-epimerase
MGRSSEASANGL